MTDELDKQIEGWRERAREGEAIAKRGKLIMMQSPVVLVPTLFGAWLMYSRFITIVGGACAAALFSYGGVLAMFGSTARRNALRLLDEHTQLPEARVVRDQKA